MKKTAIVILVAAFLSISAKAQTIQEGVSNLLAERHQSAKSVFDRLISANPNNLEAIYWLGQTHIAMGDVASAKNLYQRTLASNGNAPFVLVGSGHIKLLEGNKAEARQLFEAAITASRGRKGNDPAILSAIGRANVSAYTIAKPYGDIDYAISKLNEAAQIAPANPEIFLNLGNAWRKKHNGSEAVLAYRKAGNFAPALYRTAMLYKTQQNWEVVVENLNTAIAADPKYTPAYEELYYYNLLNKRDFQAAENYASKVISSADPSIENEYLKAQTLYVQNKFDEAINVGKSIVRQSPNAKPRVYRLLAYSYLGSKDTAAACENSKLFLSKADEEELLGQDYILQATACGRNNPAIIRAGVMKAVQMDSVLHRQIAMLNEAIEGARVNGQRLLEAELRAISYQLRGTNSDPNELISYIAVPYYFGGAYAKADSVAKVYSAILPDSIHGHYWSALSLSAIDTSMQLGLAIPSYEKVLTIAETSPTRLAGQGVRAATTLALYYNNVKLDRPTAIRYVERGLALEPTNANLLSIQKALQPANTRQPSPSSGKKQK